MRDPLTTYQALLGAVEPGFRLVDGSLLQQIYINLGDTKTARSITPGWQLGDPAMLADIARRLNQPDMLKEVQQPGKRLVPGGWLKRLLYRFLTPSNTVAPVATYTAAVGQTPAIMRTTNGTWTNSPTQFTYEWFMDGAPMHLPFSSWIVVPAQHSGHSFVAQVTAYNPAGSGVSAPSNAVV